MQIKHLDSQHNLRQRLNNSFKQYFILQYDKHTIFLFTGTVTLLCNSFVKLIYIGIDKTGPTTAGSS